MHFRAGGNTKETLCLNESLLCFAQNNGIVGINVTIADVSQDSLNRSKRKVEKRLQTVSRRALKVAKMLMTHTFPGFRAMHKQ